jgi:hypothetical protein
LENNVPLPYSKSLDNEWARKQNFTNVVWGDEIFEVVKLGAQRLEASWEGAAHNWERLIPKAVKRGFLGWGEPIVRPEWLRHMLFVQEKYWPKGLSPKEKLILRLAVEISRYFPGKDMSFSEILDARANPKAGIIPSGTPEQNLQALKSFALLYEKEVLNVMWDAYSAESKHAAPKIMKACEKVYGEACELQEAREIFYGDMDRAWKIKTLKFSYVTYKVYGLMVDYINLVAGT